MHKSMNYQLDVPYSFEYDFFLVIKCILDLKFATFLISLYRYLRSKEIDIALKLATTIQPS